MNIIHYPNGTMSINGRWATGTPGIRARYRIPDVMPKFDLKPYCVGDDVVKVFGRIEQIAEDYSANLNPNDKHCPQCGNEILIKQHENGAYYFTAYLKQKYCSKQCVRIGKKNKKKEP